MRSCTVGGLRLTREDISHKQEEGGGRREGGRERRREGGAREGEREGGREGEGGGRKERGRGGKEEPFSIHITT